MAVKKYPGPGAPRTGIRWIVLLFLFIATVLLYTDRAALGIMAPFLQKEIGWTEEQYGKINTAFMVGYANMKSRSVSMMESLK